MGNCWQSARKKPIEIEYRGPYTDPAVLKTIEGDFEVDEEYIDNHEGYVIIRGVDGETYPCALDIFEETYEQHVRSRESNLAEYWEAKARKNIERWGNQRHDTLLLALIEEVGEIAMTMESNNETGAAPHPYVDGYEPYGEGLDLIHEMAVLGRRTQDFLESNYGDPAGESDAGKELELHGDPKDVEPILKEVADAAPLCWQLNWALQEQQQNTEADTNA